MTTAAYLVGWLCGMLTIMLARYVMPPVEQEARAERLIDGQRFALPAVDDYDYTTQEGH